ncbi:MAG TPA: sodium:solute symporter [Vicinamibacteria bacterium]|nr:sodium:solute symporter [Vicinamibacteria bacterium]
MAVLSTAFATADWVVLAVYVVAIVAFGLWVGRGTRGIDDFFLAGRQMRWWAAGLSVMATQISAITFVGTTGQAYTKGMSFIAFYFGLPFAMVVLSLTVVPFFYRARVFTAYEYLERRFDGRTRTLTSLLFLLSRGLAVGVTLYAPSLVLSVVLGWSEAATIALMGGTTILYVVYGGNRSVIWTDVVQMALIWFGIFLCVGVAIARLPAEVGLRDALALAQTANRLETVDLSLDLTKPYTLWSGLIGGMFLAMAYFGCDQSQVQRYLSGRSLTESRLSLLFNAFLKVPMQFLILLTGVLVFVFFHFHETPLLWNRAELAQLVARAPAGEVGRLRAEAHAAHEERRTAATAFATARRAGLDSEPAREAYRASQLRLEHTDAEVRRLAGGPGAPVNDVNYIFPSFVVSQLRGGLAGLVIAVIFAAAMSTLAAELSSLATATVVDFYKRFVNTTGSGAHDLLVSRVFTAVWGLFAALVALEAGRLGSAIEVVNRFGSYFYGSILGVFALAILTPRATARGAFYGLIAGMATVFLVSQYTSIAFLWYNVVGALTVFVVGLVITAASGGTGEAGRRPGGVGEPAP